MKKPRAPARTPRHDLVVQECRRLNRIAEEKAARELEWEHSVAGRRARVAAEERRLLAELAEREAKQ